MAALRAPPASLPPESPPGAQNAPASPLPTLPLAPLLRPAGRIAQDFSDKANWIPQRLVARRDSAKGAEFLVKWDSEGAGLTYDQCTWESGDEGVLAEEQYADLKRSLAEREAAARDRAAPQRQQAAVRIRMTPLQRLAEQPAWLAPQRENSDAPRPQLMPHQTEAVNWLRKCYQGNQNVILADEMGLGKT